MQKSLVTALRALVGALVCALAVSCDSHGGRIGSVMTTTEKASYDAHVAITSGNPHGTTAAMVGAATTATRLDQFAAPTAAVSLNSQKITNLATPTASTDAVTKAYADGLGGGGGASWGTATSSDSRTLSNATPVLALAIPLTASKRTTLRVLIQGEDQSNNNQYVRILEASIRRKTAVSSGHPVRTTTFRDVIDNSDDATLSTTVAENTSTDTLDVTITSHASHSTTWSTQEWTLNEL